MTIAPASVPVQLTVRGRVPDRARSYVMRKVEQVLAHAHAPVLHAHVVVTVEHDPALERPARIEVGIDVNGTPVRAHASVPDLHQAADLVEQRLRRGLVQLQDRVRTRHRWIGIAQEHEWRHSDLPRPAVAHYPRPAEERGIGRRKTLAPEPLTPDEAAYDMDLLDHDFYLFTDLDTGAPAVISRSPDGYVLYGTPTPGAQGGPPPILTEAEARRRLGVSGEPFVFYLDRDDAQAPGGLPEVRRALRVDHNRIATTRIRGRPCITARPRARSRVRVVQPSHHSARRVPGRGLSPNCGRGC